MNGFSVKEGELKPALPYLNNARVILFTVAVNALAVFIFQWGRPITIRTILMDAAFAGVTTSFINVFIVERRLKKMRDAGSFPSEAPIVRQMSRLPQNPLALAIVFGAVFALLTPAFNLLVIWFYEISSFTFERFAVWKALYSCLLSALILEWAILRYVQPECAPPSPAKRSGAEEVKNPLRRISAVKEIYNSAVDDFGFNMIIGLLLGGTVIRGHEVVIMPTARGAIVISGVILGIIVTLRMALPIAKKIKDLRETGELPVAAESKSWTARLPYSPLKFAFALMPPITFSCTAVFWAILTFFGFEELNFFQFFFIRLVFVSLLGKEVLKLAISRYRQPLTKSGK